ncbi:hypothetical protein [Limnobacter sp.]|uniref:hypothetical protein n=1 Tax=Limnobacter sp. TaxID=2003368 RepID=UPI0027333F3B|nr:hypothetical protein [Limnobacter sp.]MDP3188704.1 hypothetical protein [Limnobacter sp.]
MNITPIFISYTRQDSEWVQAISASLADKGEFFKAYDTALQTLVSNPHNTALHNKQLHSINTWGDGIFAVFNHVAALRELNLLRRRLRVCHRNLCSGVGHWQQQ